MRALRLLFASASLLSPVLLLSFGCSDGASTGGSGGTGTTTTTSFPTVTTSGTTSSETTSATGGTGTGGTGGSTPAAMCPAKFSYAPPGTASNVRVAGEWQGFDLATAPVMTGPTAGVYSVTVNLPPGTWGYKIVYDDQSQTPQWNLDPNQGRRKYVGGVENSAIKVPDCNLPSFDVKTSVAARPSAGQGTYQAELAYVDGAPGSGADTQGFTAVLSHEGTEALLGGTEMTVAPDGKVTLSLKGLVDGKYKITLKAKAKDGRVSEPVRLVFWIEPEAFSWKDALIYMIVTDRFKDGDPSNNAPPAAGADPRGDFQGGDFQGVTQAIADGTLDKLGVRALWLTPFGTNPEGAYLASDGVHLVTGYHGYWPVKGREVDPRLGGEAALKAMVAEAHKHGIRVLQDFVIHHAHQEHEYVKAHPDWFILNGCVCGTGNCDWTAHALDCKFTDYLPNYDFQNAGANQAVVDDAVWWVDTFDLDGLRIDAVKHVPEAATRNVAAEVREAFEKAGTKHFLMGETAMGWNDCADPCNDENYGTISRYIGPLGLDGQFDFVLYHGVSYKTFAYQEKGFIHADYWFKHGAGKWPQGAIMTPYIGSHDTSRFVSQADYRGQDAAHDPGIPGNQWNNIAVAPTDGEPYRRMRIAQAWVLGLPGAPLLYYGDEYGQWGGADPNNRLMWKPESSLTSDEAATLGFVRKVATARKNIPALRRGDYVSVYTSNDDTMIYGRSISPGQGALVGITRLGTAQTVMVDLATTMGFPAGTKLKDAMGGPDVNVSAGQTSITIPASSAVILAP
jgi:neopullulanase